MYKKIWDGCCHLPHHNLTTGQRLIWRASLTSKLHSVGGICSEGVSGVKVLSCIRCIRSIGASLKGYFLKDIVLTCKYHPPTHPRGLGRTHSKYKHRKARLELWFRDSLTAVAHCHIVSLVIVCGNWKMINEEIQRTIIVLSYVKLLQVGENQVYGRGLGVFKKNRFDQGNFFNLSNGCSLSSW